MNIQKNLLTLSILVAFSFGNSAYANNSKKITPAPKSQFSSGVSQPTMKSGSTKKLKPHKNQFSTGVSQPAIKKK